MTVRITALTLLAALFMPLLLSQDASAQTPPSFEECEAAVDEDALREHAVAGARATIEASIDAVDYEAIVAEAWRAARFDRRFERLVDDKIEEVRADRNFFERLADANVPSFAEEVAERTTQAIFDSAEFEELQAYLIGEITRRLEPEFAVADDEAVDTATQCLRVYLGARYSSVVQSALASELVGGAEGPIEISVSTSSATVNLASILGALLIVAFRRALRRVIESLVRRLVGVILARIASFGTVLVGVVVLTYDVITGSDGIFPVIREELLSVETRAEIQQSIVDELGAVGAEALEGRAAAIGAELVARWRAFRENHRRVLELAEREADVARYLEQLRPEDFEKFSTLVAVIYDEGGETAVLTALRDGVLPRAMNIPLIDDQARALASEGVSVEALIGWADLAGGDYPTALAFGLPTVVAPDALDRAGLRTLLELDTPAQARKVAGLDDETRGTLLNLAPGDLRVMAQAFDALELEAVVDAVQATPDRRQQRRFLERVVAAPETARALADPDVASVVAASASPDAALEVLLDPSSRWDPFAFIDHVDSVVSGEVAPLALAHRYGWAAAILFGAPLIVLLGLLRFVFGVFAPRRR